VRVEVRDVSKRYGELLALDRVGFVLEAGERVALVGPNGSGKSTLNRALMGLLRHEGEIRIDGVSPRDDRLDSARRVVYVPQIAPALAAPVQEAVRALARLRGIDPARVTELAGALSLDLAAVAERPVRGLSGGMKQKLLLALAFAADASLLILDEPTGSLDTATRERFFELLDAAARDATVILCSHRSEDLAGRVERELELSDGRLVHDGPARAGAGSPPGVVRAV
jgi:ABC-type multidrug transport system ATPase subunit